MHLLDFVNDIFDIAAVNDVDWGVAKDMFIANIHNCQTPNATYYAGAKVDFVNLISHEAELLDSTMQFNAVVSAHYVEICELRKDGKRDEVMALVKGE